MGKISTEMQVRGVLFIIKEKYAKEMLKTLRKCNHMLLSERSQSEKTEYCLLLTWQHLRKAEQKIKIAVIIPHKTKPSKEEDLLWSHP
jgi:predicted DNA binding protein